MPRKTRTHPPDKSRLVKAELRRLEQAAHHGNLLAWCEAQRFPRPTFEYVFHSTRKWRFDVCWPERRVAMEIEGQVWRQGRHTRGAGFLADMEKYNEATALGWKVLRCARRTPNPEFPAVLYRPQMADWLRRVL